MLGIGLNEVICTCRRMGGAFGGKETQAALPALMAALVTKQTGRSARIAYDKDTDMHVTGKRHRSEVNIRLLDEKESLGLKVELHSNGGAYTDLSQPLWSELCCMLTTLISSQIYCSRAGLQNYLPPNTAFRGLGPARNGCD